MKNSAVLLVISVLLNFVSNAQIKIGGSGTPVSSAVLELTGNNRGLLLPQVDLFTLTNNDFNTYGLNDPNGSGPKEGMIVYNATNLGKYTVGLYIWQNNTWTRLTTGELPISSLLAAEKVNSINNENFAQTWNWNSATTENSLTIATPNLTTGTGLLIDGGDKLIADATGSGKALRVINNSMEYIWGGTASFESNKNHSGVGVLINDSSTMGIAQATMVPNLTEGIGLAISSGNQLTTGSALKVLNQSAGNLTNGAVVFESSADHTGIGFQVSDATTGGFAQFINANQLTTGIGLAVYGAPTLTTGNALRVATESANNLANGAVWFENNADHTGIGFQVSDVTTGGTAQLINVPDLQSGFGLNIFGGTQLTSGNLLKVINNGVNIASGNGAVKLQSDADHVANSSLFLLQDATTQGTIQKIDATTLTTGNGLLIDGGSLLNTGGSLLKVINNSAAITTDGAIKFKSNQDHFLTVGAGPTIRYPFFSVEDVAEKGIVQSITANSLTSGTALSIVTTSSGLASANGVLQVANKGTSTNGILARFESNQSNQSDDSTGMTIRTNGNVGIGARSPSHKLVVSNGNVEVNNGRLISTQTTAPTVSNPSNNLPNNPTLLVNSTDTKGRIITTGTITGNTSVSVRLAFGTSATGANPIVVITPANAAARQCAWHVGSPSNPLSLVNGGFNLEFTTPSGGVTSPQFNYIVIN